MARFARKCGPNWVPKWLFNEAVFHDCCVVHDIAYEESSGKIKADVDFLKCMWKTGGREKHLGWRFRNRVQAILLFLLLVLLPYSWIAYGITRIKNIKS